MTRRDVLKALGLVTVAAALVRPWRSLRGAKDTPAKLPFDSIYKRMKRLRVDYLLAAGNPEKQAAISGKILALFFEMRREGASFALMADIGVSSSDAALREVAALRSSRLPRAMASWAMRRA